MVFVLECLAIAIAIIFQQSLDIRERASVDPYFNCTSSDIAALQLACPNGFSTSTCSCNSVAQNPNPTTTQQVVVPTTLFCIPGTTTCSGGIMNTCTHSTGTYSSYRCPYGCDGNACSTEPDSEKVTDDVTDACVPGSSICKDSIQYTCSNSNGSYTSIYCRYGCDGNNCMVPSIITSKPVATVTEVPGSFLKFGNTEAVSGICASKGGLRAIAGCFNTSDMKYWCNDPGTSEIKTCETGRGTCLNNKCQVSLATVTPIPTPTVQIVDEFLDSKPHFSGGVCKCYMNRNGQVTSREYVCKNQNLCCDDTAFKNTKYGQDICSRNLAYLIPEGAEVRPNLFLQTNPELVNYNANFTHKGCGPTVLTNICLQAQKDNCSIDEIAEKARLGPNGTTFENLLSTLNNDIGLPSEYLFARSSDSGKEYPMQINQPLSGISDQYMKDMERQTAEGNILLAHIIVNGTDHLVYFDSCVNSQCRGVDTYFHQNNSEINNTGQVYTIDFSKWDNATLVEVAVIEMPE